MRSIVKMEEVLKRKRKEKKILVFDVTILVEQKYEIWQLHIT